MADEDEPRSGKISDCSWQRALNMDVALPVSTQSCGNDYDDDDDDDDDDGYHSDRIVPADDPRQSLPPSSPGRVHRAGCKRGPAERPDFELPARADSTTGGPSSAGNVRSSTPLRRRYELHSSTGRASDVAKRVRLNGISAGETDRGHLPSRRRFAELSPSRRPRLAGALLGTAAADDEVDAVEDDGAEEASADEEGNYCRPNLPRPTWCQLSRAGDAAPSMLAGHAAVAHSGFLFIFGGFDGAAERDIKDLHVPHSNALYQYHVESNTWRTLSPNGEGDPEQPAPCARRHASLVLNGDSLFLYGGFNARCETLGDLWEFQVGTRLWRLVHPFRRRLATTDIPFDEACEGSHEEKAKIHAFGTYCALEVPSPRAEHTAVVFHNRAGRHMLVFAGYDGKKKLNDLYLFNFERREWYRPLNSSTNAPNRRCKHSSVLYNGKLWVTAGFQCYQGENYARTDMHCLDLETFLWSPILMEARSPEALQGHRAVVVGDFMYVIGGKVRRHGQAGSDGYTSELNDVVYQYHFAANTWQTLETIGRKPPPRQLHIAVGVESNGDSPSIFICGGADKSRRTYYTDVWELRDIPRPRRIAVDCGLCSMTSAMLNNPLFSDVTFVVEGLKVYGHRAILYSRCEYFRCMLEVGMRESSSKEIVVPDLRHDVFLGVLEHVYTGKVTLSEGSVALDCLLAADMFGIDELREQCVEKVEQALTVENAAFVCQVADKANAFRLKRRCINFILHNFRNVINTDAWTSLDSELEREILQAYAGCCTFDPSAFRNSVRPP